MKMSSVTKNCFYTDAEIEEIKNFVSMCFDKKKLDESEKTQFKNLKIFFINVEDLGFDVNEAIEFFLINTELCTRKWIYMYNKHGFMPALTDRLSNQTQIEEIFQLFEHIKNYDEPKMNYFPPPYRITSDKVYIKEIINNYVKMYGQNYYQKLVNDFIKSYVFLEDLPQIRDMIEENSEFLFGTTISYSDQQYGLNDIEWLMVNKFWDKKDLEKVIHALIDIPHNFDEMHPEDYPSMLDAMFSQEKCDEIKILISNHPEWGMDYTPGDKKLFGWTETEVIKEKSPESA